jgi:hypothetical protein
MSKANFPIHFLVFLKKIMSKANFIILSFFTAKKRREGEEMKKKFFFI